MQESQPIFDVFQKGLVRGGENLAYDPVKKYFYVEHPAEGWRVYLRACCFIHEVPAKDSCIDPKRFIVVKRADKVANGREWEPPKGQMEWKDAARKSDESVMQLLRENVKREVAEESRIKRIVGLRHTSLIFQGREQDYPPNTFFQYHIFQALVYPKEWMRASAELDWYRAHPLAFARLRRDKREKDAIDWYSPSDHKLMGKWSPKIVSMYLNHFSN
jgi:ADP-ribose pyrophosphatase YjhB (NUDIX family)